jgi:hypothetical protein
MNTLHQIAVAIDQLGNTLLGGWADETLSSRAWRMSRRSCAWNVVRRLIDLLFFWQWHHCETAYESERDRLQEPPELRL